MPYNLPDKGAILAIDLGQKFCGLAVSDPSQSLAFPMQEISYESQDVFIESIKKIIDSKKIQGILLGLPYSLGSQNNFIHQWIEEQDKLLQRAFALPIEYMDESLTSLEAKEKSVKKYQRVDSQAALIFLQKYLEARHGFSFHEF